MENLDTNYKVPNLEKGLAVLDYLSYSTKGKTLQEIKNDLEISQTTAYRILNTMVRLEYLTYNEDSKRYKLSRKLLTMGFRALNEHQLLETVLPHLRNLRDETKEVRTAIAEPDFSDDDIFEEGCVYLTPETAPFPFAFDDEPQPEEHNPATVRMTRKDLFEQLYAQTADLSRKDRKAAILAAMLPYFQDEFAAEMFVEGNFNRKIRNLIARKIRLARKTNLQEFNFSSTMT